MTTLYLDNISKVDLDKLEACLNDIAQNEITDRIRERWVVEPEPRRDARSVVVTFRIDLGDLWQSIRPAFTILSEVEAAVIRFMLALPEEESIVVTPASIKLVGYSGRDLIGYLVTYVSEAPT